MASVFDGPRSVRAETSHASASRRVECLAIGLAALGLLLAPGCAPARSPNVTAPATPATAAAAAAAEFPEGPGRAILMASCTSCHDLREVTKFRGFYARPQWRDIIVTMVEYGAPVAKNDVEVLADYLTQHLGKKP